MIDDVFIGTKINDITVISSKRSDRNVKQYEYQCKCGRIGFAEKNIIENWLENICSMRSCRINFYDQYIGQTFGNRTIIKFDKHIKSFAYYIVECKCKKIDSIKITELLKGRSTSCRSCGAQKAIYNIHKEGKLTHSSYHAMKKRCYYKKDHGYYNYGARGIKVCDRWLESFDNFCNDMGLRPSKDHQIDRIDPEGNYEPNNCKWSLALDNCTNTRWNLKNRWRYAIVDKTKLCKKCIKHTENNNEEEIKIKENLNQMTIS